MKTALRLFNLSLVLAFANQMSAAGPGDFRDHLGLQLWSLRDQTKANPAAALDLARSYGFTEVETAGTAGLPVAEFAVMLKARGLVAVSAHTGYGRLEKDLAGAIAEAKALGAKFLICPSPPKGKHGFDEAQARKTAAAFNRFGEACREAGIRFGFHPHGEEFRPIAPGVADTAFDVLVRETKPELVCFEMDVFWIVHAGQDPVKLLAKYPDRWALLHLKDIRKGAVTGLSSGSAAPTDNVPVGAGQIDWNMVLRTAEKIGVRHFFIEDETPSPLQCIPASLSFLKNLTL